jgi:hypothetical protein
MTNQNTLTLWKSNTPLSGHLTQFTTVTKSIKTGRETIKLLPISSKEHECIKDVSGKSGAVLKNLVTDIEQAQSDWLAGELAKAHATGRIKFTRMSLALTGRGSVSFKPSVATSITNANVDQTAERAGQLGFKLVPIEGAVQSNGKAPEQQPLIDAATGEVEAPKGKGKGKGK